MSVIFQFVIWWKHQTSSFKIKTFSHLYNIEKYELKIIQIWQFLATAWSRRREICFWLSSAAENLADGLPHKRHDMLSSSYIIQLGLQCRGAVEMIETFIANQNPVPWFWFLQQIPNWRSISWVIVPFLRTKYISPGQKTNLKII